MQLYSCPRCSGKGYIDTSDIQRLSKTNKWVEGPCFYCNGHKTIDSTFTNNVSPSDDFLSMQRSDEERLLYAKDPQTFVEFNTIFSSDEISDEYRLKLINAGMDAKTSIKYEYKEAIDISSSLVEKGFQQHEIDRILTYIKDTQNTFTPIDNEKDSDTNKPHIAIRVSLCVALVVIGVILFKSIGTSVVVFRFIVGAVIIFLGKIIMTWGIE